MISRPQKNEEVVETLYDRILGRVTLHDVHHPQTGELIIGAGEELLKVLAGLLKIHRLNLLKSVRYLPANRKRCLCQMLRT
jgi:DNA-directed RNA polymerase subunit beta'